MEAHPAAIPPLRLAILQNIVAPTRHALFRALADRVDLTVLFMARTEPNRAWTGREEIDYPHEFLRGIHVPLSRPDDVEALHVNPGIVGALRRGRFDALLCGGYLSPTTWLAQAACKRTATPFLLWFGSSWTSPGRAKRAFVRRSDGFVAYGDLAAARLHELGALPARVRIALNTTDVRAFAAAPREEDRPPTVLWAGRFLPRKRADLAIELIARLAVRVPDVRAVFVGDGPGRRDAERLARLHGLDAVFAGDRPYAAMPSAYAGADLLVTLAEREPWGLVVNEALAAGVPVLAGPGVAAARELVPPGGGTVGHPDVLLGEAERLLTSPAALAAARAAAAAVLPRLVPERWAEAVAEAATAAAAL